MKFHIILALIVAVAQAAPSAKCKGDDGVKSIEETVPACKCHADCATCGGKAAGKEAELEASNKHCVTCTDTNVKITPAKDWEKFGECKAAGSGSGGDTKKKAGLDQPCNSTTKDTGCIVGHKCAKLEATNMADKAKA